MAAAGYTPTVPRRARIPLCAPQRHRGRRGRPESFLRVLCVSAKGPFFALRNLHSALLLFLLPGLLPAWTDWQTLQGPHFQVIYRSGYDWEARQAYSILEGYRQRVSDLTGGKPGRTPVVIEDLGTLSNGSTDPVFGSIHLFTYPPDASSEIGFGQNWWRMVGVHEYIHMAHLTNAHGVPGVLTAVLGSVFHPNIFSPGWIAEGITVYGESQLSPYEGRLNDGFYDAYIAARVAEHRFPSIMDATYSPREFPSDGIYLYGGTFFRCLAERYGPGKFAGLFQSYGSLLTAYFTPCTPCLGLDVAAAGQFPANGFPALYAGWQRYEQERNRAWRVDGERLTRQGWTANYTACSQDRLYYYRDRVVKTGPYSSFTFSDILCRDLRNQQERTVVRVNSWLTCPLKVSGQKLYYAAADLQPGKANVSYLGLGVVSNLHARDLVSGRDEVLLCDRLRCFSPLADGRIIYARDRRHAFGSEMLIFDPGVSHSVPRPIVTTDLLIGEIAADASRIVVSARPDWQNWSIYALDLGSLQFAPLVSTPWMESGLNLSDSRLFSSANYDRVYSGYTYDFETRTFSRLTQGGYATWPVAQPGSRDIYFVGLNSLGNDLYRKTTDFSDKFIPPESLFSERPELPDPDQLRARRGSYLNTLGSLIPVIHVPMLLPADTSLRTWDAGLFLMGMDATGEHSYQLTLTERITRDSTTRLSKPALSFDYQSLFFAPASVNLSLATVTPFGSVQVSYPFLVRPDCRLSRLVGSLELDIFAERLQRKALTPSLSAGLSWPETKVGLLATCMLERRFWGSGQNSKLVDLVLSARRYVWHSELNLTCEGFMSDFSTALRMTGYSDSVMTRSGMLARLEYSLPLLKIHWGLWNPNIYFEDLCGSAFTDFNCDFKTQAQAFSGARLQLETGILLGFAQIVPWVGAGITATGKPEFIYGIDLASTVISGQSPKSRVIADVTGRDRNRPLAFLDTRR